MNATKKIVYEVRYVGAPYESGSEGHAISTHDSLDAAHAAKVKWQRRDGDQYKIVKLVDGEVVPLIDDEGNVDC